MRRFQIPVLLTALLLAAPSLAHAQAKSGDKEVLIFGNFTSLSQKLGGSLGNIDTSSGTFSLGIGFFVSDRIEIGVGPRFTVSTNTIPGQPAQPEVRFGNTVIVPGRAAIPASTDVDVDGGLSGSIQFFFSEASSRTKPYVGGQMNVNSFKTNGGEFADNLFAQFLVGVKNYISDRAALDFSSAYGFRPNAPSDFRLLTVQVGITVLF
jgi:hypothetical protein